jgi:DNA-binding response OmpR family regulator
MLRQENCSRVVCRSSAAGLGTQIRSRMSLLCLQSAVIGILVFISRSQIVLIIRPVKQTVFVVEDDQDIARLVGLHLEQAGFVVRLHFSAARVLIDAEEHPPALFLLDVMLPGSDGTLLCQQIRRSELLRRIPVIFLTARNSEADKIAGLELGADDYITKPFSPRELVARVRAVLRRFESEIPAQPLIFGGLEIDPASMLVRVQGKVVSTTATEFRLLAHLAQNPRRVFTREQVLDAVWKDTAYVTLRSVDVYIRRLREKIELNPDDPRFLITVRGAGYRFEAEK